MTKILVTGGAGYIGAHTVRQLVAAGMQVVVLDNLYSGQREAVPAAAEFVQGDIADRELVADLIRRHRFGAVLHFAAHIVVPESVANPGKYYRNNVLGSLHLLESCIKGGVNRFIFSSSAAVYGTPAHSPVAEDAPAIPINPYGSSKLVTEWTLRDFAAAQPNFAFVALRYFNVAGNHPALGQAKPPAAQPATHLIKVACEVASGARAGMQIFGDDYPTADGTCVRDYIHVQDLADAHLKALDYLAAGGSSEVLNCGYGRGYSVREVLDCIQAISGKSGREFAVTTAPRRAGDPPELVADTARIRQILAWTPRYDDLATICASAYQWQQGFGRG